jgi:hypothetical protein
MTILIMPDENTHTSNSKAIYSVGLEGKDLDILCLRVSDPCLPILILIQ